MDTIFDEQPNPSEMLIKGLNEAQAQAVQHLEGPLLLLAGAGSGKTKCLTHRIANLMANGVAGKNILAVTFTNKAAAEMKERIETLLHGLPLQTVGYTKPTVGTFHAVCVRILRKEIGVLDRGYTSNYVIFDTTDQRNLIKRIMGDLGYDEKEYKHRAILSHISTAKNNLQWPRAYNEEADKNKFTRAVYAVYKEYEKRLIAHNALDFDDLLFRTYEVYKNHGAVLERYRNRWQYILVDEYQDTNTAQYQIVQMLAEPRQNLCVIGDDHQSIYSFRGADWTNILNFANDYPKAKTIKLEQNYRSTGNVLACANALIGHNKTGHKKDLWTSADRGEKVKIVQVMNEKEEGDYIAKAARDHREEGGRLSDCVVLYRMNAQSRAIEEALMRRQVPYRILGGTRFFDRREIKDIVAYLRLLFNPRDDEAFLRIINVPKRQMGPKTISVLRTYANNYTMSLYEVLQGVAEVEELPAKKRAALGELYTKLETLKEKYLAKPISILLDHLIDTIQYKKFLDDGTDEGESRIQNVQELFSVAGRYDTADNPLASFLEGVALLSDLDQHDANAESITLMTIHSSKGLEWPKVFLPGWEENVFPSGMGGPMAPDQLEEERRLGYVAITRAKAHLHITHARQRMLYGKTNYAAPSKFISELDETACEMVNLSTTSRISTGSRMSFNGNGRKTAPRELEPFSDELPDYLKRQPKSRDEALWGAAAPAAKNDAGYASSDRIRHAEWGEGTIIQVNGDVLSVAFRGQGIKKIVASVSPIEKVV